MSLIEAEDGRTGRSYPLRPLVVGTSFTLDDSHYPNFNKKDRRTFYWQNIAVMMATAKRFILPPTELVVFTTDEPTTEVAPVLDSIGAKIVKPPFRYQPPEKFYRQFNGAFYLFDAMEWCVDNRGIDYDYLFLDPDCVLTADIGPMRETLRDYDVVGYELPHRADIRNGGMLPDEFRQIAEELTGSRIEPALPQYGGELLAFSGSGLQRMTDALPDLWQTNVARFHAGKAKFNTEELVISYLIWRDRPHLCNAKDRFVKRFWTNFRYYNVGRGEEALPVWHLPAEKARGIPRLFRAISRGTVRLEEMSEDEVKAYVAGVVGLRNAWLRQASFRLLSLMGQANDSLP